MSEQRKAFELWACARWPVGRERHADGSYENVLLNVGWIAWQAAQAAMPVVEPAAQIARLTSDCIALTAELDRLRASDWHLVPIGWTRAEDLRELKGPGGRIFLDIRSESGDYRYFPLYAKEMPS